MSEAHPGKSVPSKRVLAGAVLLAVAFVLRVGLAVRYPAGVSIDEIFQTLEPAHRLAYGIGVTTWEWRLGVRSWIFPAFLAGIMRSTAWLAHGSAGYLMAIIVILSLASLSTVWFAYAWTRRVSSKEAAVLAACACAVSLLLVYMGSKALNEVVATDVLLPGLYLGVFPGTRHERIRLFYAGVLCGLAVSLRMQLIPAVAFALLYFCYRHGGRRHIPALAAGFALPVLTFGMVDWITWSYPWQSVFLYYTANIVQGRAAHFGVPHWYWYIEALPILIGPVLLFVWQGARRSPFLALVSLIVFVSHTLVAHKELRYLYPIIPLVITLAAIGFVDVAARLKPRFNLPEFSWVVVAFGTVCIFLSSLCALYYRPRLGDMGPSYAFDRLSRDPAPCGVALYRFGWFQSGGYTHLHRNVPLFWISSSDILAQRTATYNAIVAPAQSSSLPPAFKQLQCSHGFCLYFRNGACQPPRREDTLNGYLEDSGN